MNVPSLLVLIVSGWGIGGDERTNLIMSSNNTFLADIISAFPVVALNSVSSNHSFYEKLANVNDDAESKMKLAEQLRIHGITKSVVSDSGRYGYLLSSLQDSEVDDHNDWHYMVHPPTSSLIDVPAGAIYEISTKASNVLRESSGAVYFVSISNIPVVAKYKDLHAIQNTVMLVDKKIKEIVSKALDAGVRVLLTSDGGMIEDPCEEQSGQFICKRTNNPTPCVLIHKNIEGLKSDTDDVTDDNLYPSNVNGTPSDLGVTILALMGITIPKSIESKVLFKEFIDQTL